LLKKNRRSIVRVSREISYSERELNTVLARDTDLEDRLVIDLSDDLISAKLLLPLDEQFPFVGGERCK